ncbi:hypothetical protein D3C81_790520 [compost metagenome]
MGFGGIDDKGAPGGLVGHLDQHLAGDQAHAANAVVVGDIDRTAGVQANLPAIWQGHAALLARGRARVRLPLAPRQPPVGCEAKRGGGNQQRKGFERLPAFQVARALQRRPCGFTGKLLGAAAKALGQLPGAFVVSMPRPPLGAGGMLGGAGATVLQAHEPTGRFTGNAPVDGGVTHAAHTGWRARCIPQTPAQGGVARCAH